MRQFRGNFLIVAGITVEKPEAANRVEFAGAGINLRTAAPTPEQIRDAVRKILSDPRYREGAQKIQAQGRRHDPPTEAAILIEQLVSTQK
jgi:UDP:flavonoid glycosyltransferase YjiC (YdhE family)